MADEYWATFSIYDHRTDLYRRALLLFDRIVVPVPKSPFGKLSAQEIEELSKEVDYLKKNNAAVRFDWDSVTFGSWQQTVASEALAKTLSRNPQLATRLQLAEQYESLIPPGVDSATAVPVYADPKSFDASAEDLRYHVEETALLEIVLPRLPIPSDDVPLSSIVKLRNTEKYRDSLYHLRKWQRKILPELLNDPDQRNLRAAATDFDRWIKQYSQAMEDAQFAKLKTAVGSVLAVGAVLCPFTSHVVAALSALASPLFSLRELRKPCWKVVSEKECAPAAIVYASEHLH